MQGYADRQLPARPVSHVVAYVSAPLSITNALQSSIANEARRRGIVAEDALEVFPPTRRYLEAEIRRDLMTRGATAVLIVKVGDSGVIAQYAGTLFSGEYSGSTIGTGDITRTGNLATVSLQTTTSGAWTGTATPLYRHSRATAFVAQLIEPSTNRMLWTGQGVVSASGRLFVGDTVGASNAVRAIFEDLQSKGLVEGPK
jgi:hypothetical protein